MGNLPSCSTATVANADTSSDDDMEMELSDYKLSPNDYLLSNRCGGIGSSATSTMKHSALTNTSDIVVASTSSNKSPLETLHSVGSQKLSSSVTTDEMSLSESDLTTNTSLPATTTTSNPSIPRRTSSSGGTQPAIATLNIGEQDEDTQSMEMSSISID